MQEKDKPTPPTVFLIGYRATGKTTVGQLLAQRLGTDFLDTDRAIETKIQMSIAECFARDGESRFRDLEGETLEEIGARVSDGDRFVVSTGGGMAVLPARVDRMRTLGKIVWLAANVETIRDRLASDASTAESRPGLTGDSAIDEVRAILSERTPIYRNAADFVVSCDPPRTPDEIADEVVRWLEQAD